VIGPGFARIGAWATAIPTSTGVPHEPPAPPGQTQLPQSTVLGLIAAPVAGRVCTTGLAIVPEVTETLVAYDDDSCIVTLDAQFDTRGIVGAMARWALLAQLRCTSQHFGDDLRHMVEHGRPSPHKLRQLKRPRRQRRST